MKNIKKKVYLEDFKSRIPLLYNSFDENGTYVDFKSMEFVDILNYYPTGNYGMIPCDLVISSESAETISTSVIGRTTELANSMDETSSYTFLDSTYDFEPEKWSKTLSSDTSGNAITEINCIIPTKVDYLFSYIQIKRMFYFFISYDELLKNNPVALNDENACDRPCKTATEYYKVHINDGNIETYNHYENLDYTYFSYGGDEMKKYLFEEVFKRFMLPQAYRLYWKTTFIWFVNALKWKRWFDERYEQYESKTSELDCKDVEDCCDCVEYFKRGGHEMRSLLNDYIRNNSSFNYVTDSANTTFEMHLVMTNSIDDMGEFSIFSNEWEGGENYSSSTVSNTFMDKCGEDYSFDKDKETQREYVDGGTVVTHNDHIYVMNKANETGYKYLDSCWEFDFDSKVWDDYMYKKFNDPFSSYTKYAYDVFDNFHISSGSINPREMAVAYPCINDNYILYNNIVYDVDENTEYIEYTFERGKKVLLKVFTDNKTKRKYISYNNKRFYPYAKNGRLVFNLTRIPCIAEGVDAEIKIAPYSVVINGTLYITSTNYFEFGRYRYAIVKKYVQIGESRYPISNNKICKVFKMNINSRFSSFVVDNETFGEYISSFDLFDNTKMCYTIEDDVMYVVSPYEEFDVGKITGTTDSKLEQLKDKNLFYDDTGVKLQGMFKVLNDKTNAQPLENHILDLPYHVGNVSRITPLIDNKDKIFAYWGDLLKEITFYYVDIDGNRSTSGSNVSDYDNDNLAALAKLNHDWLVKYSSGSSMEENIIQYDKALNDVSNGLHITDELRCDVVYYLGAILDRIDDAPKPHFDLKDYGDLSKYTCGVKYTDTYKVKTMPTRYNLTKRISYNIYFYGLVPLDSTEAVYTDPSKTFKRLNPLTKFEININSSLKDSHHSYPTDKQEDAAISAITYSKYNNRIFSPVFREEYKFGTSSIQKVEENIYINRGIDKAMDKGLKLIEITTLEDLEQYNNGFFKIINNS